MCKCLCMSLYRLLSSPLFFHNESRSRATDLPKTSHRCGCTARSLSPTLLLCRTATQSSTEPEKEDINGTCTSTYLRRIQNNASKRCDSRKAGANGPSEGTSSRSIWNGHRPCVVSLQSWLEGKLSRRTAGKVLESEAFDLLSLSQLSMTASNVRASSRNKVWMESRYV